MIRNGAIFRRTVVSGITMALLLPLVAILASWELGPALRAWYFGAYGFLHLCLGCLALLYIGDMTGGRWNERLVEFFDIGRRLIPIALLLIAPTFFFLDEIYVWSTHALHSSGDGFTKAEYLTPGPFLLRMVGYAIIYLGLGFTSGATVKRIRRRRDREWRPASAWSAAGLVAYASVGIFASTDLIMSLAPEWFSSGLPVILMASQALMAYSMALASRLLLIEDARETEPFFGNLLIATLMFWAYVTFVQFLIIWMGNISEDIGYYLTRSTPGWVAVSIFLALFIFALPLIALANPSIKRRRTRLAAIAAFLFFGQCVYLAWVILPSWSTGAMQTLIAASAMTGFMGVWIAWCGLRLGREAIP